LTGQDYNDWVLSERGPVTESPPGNRLESWKEIAAYLSRSERTVRRWEEKEGLPVHRLQHDKRGSVYAYRSELDVWRESRRPSLEMESTEPVPGVPAQPSRRWWWAAAILVLVAGSVAGIRLLEHRRQPAARRSSNPEAQRAYERAGFGPNVGRAQIQSGIKYYQEAVRLDPQFAEAWRGLASAHVGLTWFGEIPASETLGQARIEAQRALTLDSSLGEAWRVLAMVSHFFDRDDATADSQFHKAMELAPTDATAISWFAESLLNRRRFAEALLYAKRAEDASPRWLEPITVAGNVHLFSGKADLAIAEYQRALEIEPRYSLANHFLGRAYLAKGRFDRAIEQLRRSNDLMGQVPFSVADLGYALAVGGHRSEAEKMFTELVHKREAGYYPAFALAEIQLGLGNAETAIDWLERGADERNLGYYLPSVDPVYDPIRSQPRFQALLRRLHL
jgi:tetratricopeptide (TPR) repeat protein